MGELKDIVDFAIKSFHENANDAAYSAASASSLDERTREDAEHHTWRAAAKFLESSTASLGDAGAKDDPKVSAGKDLASARMAMRDAEAMKSWPPSDAGNGNPYRGPSGDLKPWLSGEGELGPLEDFEKGSALNATAGELVDPVEPLLREQTEEEYWKRRGGKPADIGEPSTKRMTEDELLEGLKGTALLDNPPDDLPKKGFSWPGSKK